ncbi:phage tail protein [Haematospirillum jordaniae]|uniref:Phage tail collar domain-containing protein n=2 Tax=Haematospirillum jordaniae TaxID=1549855 RepID=A0A143DC03_9PROT|nr:phage tail protein [Haematospirillum jordaniae]AMW34271.1 hypothetical protein AY555_02710 [Haematospirillum jordaniae]NKD60101.1 phage tail protein [Haematospirillum jordaniae]
MRCVGPVSGMTSTGPVLAEDGTPFVNVNPAANTPGSAVPAQVFNVILQELTHLVRHAGLSPSTDDSDLEQVRKAVEALIAARRVDPEDATPTTPGIVRLATADEVSAGTDAEKAVTPAALAQAFPAPVGSVIMHAGQEPPPLYLKCNGALLSRAAYHELFTVIGTTFGSGDGSTTFAVPDLRGEFLRGWDDGRGVDSGRAFGSAQSDDFESHSHVSIGRSFNQGAFFATTGGYGIWPNGNVDPNHHRTSSEGGGETRPRNIALLPCIRFR